MCVSVFSFMEVLRRDLFPFKLTTRHIRPLPAWIGSNKGLLGVHPKLLAGRRVHPLDPLNPTSLSPPLMYTTANYYY